MSESFPHSDSDSASSSSGDEAEWRAVANGDNSEGEEEEPPAIVSLVDGRVFTDPAAALEHCKAKSGLDVLATRDRLGLDFHGMVKLINFGMFFPSCRFFPSYPGKKQC
jgi:protein arginine N-methyltransferase 3